ncbi:NAD(P)-binding domain-containing protein [Paenibacillus larvae]|uniref:hypothetical protein n=1 Tax=Paenibacillus larvae TaxID=1464 RepID=UPI0022813DE6|nr:hypothetical protein [Paenibacillus larvae]MCY9752560.1 NAD(P)-binding domain-containing protein [Paenibacillus larvae]MEC0088833.1 hypothetical protein [Paenibacillus larvae]MEC0188738.1 hypothetical protein [Paenibacillus larvae]
MKKKLLVLTVALSLTLSSLIPITSLAAQQNETTTKIDTMAPTAERIDRAAKFVAKGHANSFSNGFMDKINKYSKKLGYLKGSKLTVKVDSTVYGEDMMLNTDTDIKFDGTSTVIGIKHMGGDPTIKASYNPSNKEFTIEKIKNANTTGHISMSTEVKYNFASWEYVWPFWYRVNDRAGTVDGDKLEKIFTNFEQAPKLQIVPKKFPHEVNLNSSVKPPEDFFNVTSSAGKVKAEFVKKPDFTHIGKHTATIRVWDEYGEEDRNDNDHNRSFDVTFNVVDKSTWKDKNLRDWQFVSGNKWGIVEDPDNSLTDDHVIYSNDSIKALKNYSLEKGATYKFTAFIKPDVLSTRDKMALSLIPEDNSPSKKREIFSSSSQYLPSVDKGFKEVSKEFTVGDGEENLTFEFFANFYKKGGYIDSFKLERIK